MLRLMDSRLQIAMCLPLLLAYCLQAHAHSPHEAQYLGNEGVLVTNGEIKVLFDAFYADSYGRFVLVPEHITQALHQGEPPFDGIDAIFVSHVHGDHFTAEPVIGYLRKHQAVRLYGPSQIIDALRKAGLDQNDPLHERITTLDIWPHSPAVSIEAEGLEMEAVAVPHAGNRPSIQNYVWRVTLGQHTTIMHLGDADPAPRHFTRHAEHFQAKRTQLAFPPYWFFDSTAGRSILEQLLNATAHTGIHVPAAAQGQGDAWRERLDGDVFTDPGEVRGLK